MAFSRMLLVAACLAIAAVGVAGTQGSQAGALGGSSAGGEHVGVSETVVEGHTAFVVVEIGGG